MFGHAMLGSKARDGVRVLISLVPAMIALASVVVYGVRAGGPLPKAPDVDDRVAAADRFWQVMDTRFLTAAASGNTQASEEGFTKGFGPILRVQREQVRSLWSRLPEPIALKWKRPTRGWVRYGFGHAAHGGLRTWI